MTSIRITTAIALILFVTAGCTRNSVDSQRDDSEEENTNQRDTSAIEGDTVSSINDRQENDADFVLAAADGGLLEVRLGELAMRQASSDDAKSFAKTMTIDHGKANDELKSIATKLNLPVPETLSEKNKQKFNDLSEKKGPEFDKAYAEMMVADHTETIEKFRTHVNGGERSEIRDWAQAKIPALEHHLMMAQKMNSGERPTGQ